MAEKSSLVEQMLEHLVNGEQQKAEELFHDYVVAKSRDIYESLIESEIAEGDDEEEKDEDEEEVEEGFDDEFAEADATDDLAGELDIGDDEGDMGDMGDMGDDEGGKESEEEIMQDLGDIIDELQAKFDALSGAEEEQGEFDDEGDMGADDEEMNDDIELETVREYVERVPAGHGAEKKGAAEKADGSATGLKFSKNDMGGTSANILSGRDGADAGGVGAGGTIKGSALSDTKPKEMKTGNLNTVGGFKGDAFKKNGAGHGAEKKGSAEGSTDGTSLFRGRR
jgi:hypothetical protein